MDERDSLRALGADQLDNVAIRQRLAALPSAVLLDRAKPGSITKTRFRSPRGLIARALTHLLSAASTTAGGVAVPNEPRAAAEAAYPREGGEWPRLSQIPVAVAEQVSVQALPVHACRTSATSARAPRPVTTCRSAVRPRRKARGRVWDPRESGAFSRSVDEPERTGPGDRLGATVNPELLV